MESIEGQTVKLTARQLMFSRLCKEKAATEIRLLKVIRSVLPQIVHIEDAGYNPSWDLLNTLNEARNSFYFNAKLIQNLSGSGQ